MLRKLPVLLAVVAVATILAVAPMASSADRIVEVLVTNLQDPQPISGQVRVQDVIPHAQTLRFTDLTVSPASRHEVNQLTEAGVIDATGFTAVTLSLQGQIKGRPFRDGDVGVLLLAEEEPILRALLEDGEIQLPLEVSTAIRFQQSSYFAASEAKLPIAFPRYRVLVYNSTDKAAAVNVFAYLTN